MGSYSPSRFRLVDFNRSVKVRIMAKKKLFPQEKYVWFSFQGVKNMAKTYENIGFKTKIVKEGKGWRLFKWGKR